MGDFLDLARQLILYWKRSLALGLSACMLTLVQPALAEGGNTYTLGVVPQYDQRKLFSIWKPIAEELSRRSGVEIRLVVTLTIPEFEAAIEKGTFDLVYANPYHILRVSTSQGYIPLVRDHDPLRGIVLVRNDSPIKKIEDLAGKTLAVPSPNALGASMLIRADLERLYGVHMSMLNTQTHSSVYLNVINNIADAGGGVQKTLAEQNQQIQDVLRIIYTTRAMPSHPIAAHPRVKPAVRELLRNTLLEMNTTPSSKALLADIPMPSPVPTSLEDYLVMRKWGLEKYWVTDGK